MEINTTTFNVELQEAFVEWNWWMIFSLHVGVDGFQSSRKMCYLVDLKNSFQLWLMRCCWTCNCTLPRNNVMWYQPLIQYSKQFMGKMSCYDGETEFSNSRHALFTTQFCFLEIKLMWQLVWLNLACQYRLYCPRITIFQNVKVWMYISIAWLDLPSYPSASVIAT